MAPGLRTLPGLSRLLVALARRRALERVARLSLPCALVGGLSALLLARYAPGAHRPLALLALLPSLVPLALAGRHARRAPLTLAMELDRRLDAHAAVVTALELSLTDPVTSGEVIEKIYADARGALHGRRPRDVTPALSSRARALLLVGVAVMAAALAAPVRPSASARPRAHAIARSTDAAQAALAAADALAAAALQDPARAQQLTAAAEAARALARDLEAGVGRDDALSRADEIDRAADEALSWARDPRHQTAVDAALSELTDPESRALRDALAQGDMARVDEAVRRLADQREASSRQRAMEALSRAADTARSAGASDLARALDEERDLLRRRGAGSDLARAISQALGATPGAQRIAEHLARADTDQELSRALDQVMRELDGRLTAEERRRIAEAMARMATQADPGSRAAFERAGRAMTPEEARAAMRALLEQLRNGSLDRTRAGNAGRAGTQARGDLARVRIGLQTGRTPGRGNGPPGAGGPGSDHDEGHIATTGRTNALQRQGFTAPVQGSPDPRNPGVPVSVEHIDTTGSQAVTPDEARIRQVAPSALHGLERTPVPEPYRRQVRTYFGQ